MDLYTYYIYIQKAKDGETKQKILGEIERIMQEEAMQPPQDPMQMME
jgi:hypothetical protein